VTATPIYDRLWAESRGGVYVVDPNRRRPPFMVVPTFPPMAANGWDPGCLTTAGSVWHVPTPPSPNRINLTTARLMAASQRRSGQSYAADILSTLIAGYTRLARAAGEITDDTPEAYK
jgi:hypothetical protein